MNKYSSKATELDFCRLLLLSANTGIEVKFLDLILISEGKPLVWIFTDTQGLLRAKPVDIIDIDELIKAIIINIEAQNLGVEHKDIWVMY